MSGWSLEQARSWWDRQAWLVGCNFIPSSAVNQLEMWQAESFDAEVIARELGWASDLGFNIVRVYLHDLAWEVDAEGLLRRIDAFLALADAQRIHTALVLFDDVWNPDPRSGPQPDPVPGRHNSRWLESPGLPALQRYESDRKLRERLEHYVKRVISTFGDDERVLVWDLYNEPGGFPSPGSEPVGAACLPLLGDVFRWAREAAPRQPVTSGLWWNPLRPNDTRIAAIQLEHSDVVSFHHYGPADSLRQTLSELRATSERPLLCTEYLARPLGSRFESHLPIFRQEKIAAISWGLVSGRTQTIHPWWSWFEAQPGSEPELWFHDILRPDGTPFDAAEVEFLRRFLGRREASGPAAGK